MALRSDFRCRPGCRDRAKRHFRLFPCRDILC